MLLNLCLLLIACAAAPASPDSRAVCAVSAASRPVPGPGVTAYQIALGPGVTEAQIAPGPGFTEHQIAPGPGVTAEQIATLGFREYIAPVEGGRIDWTRGELLVDGIGRAKSTSTQHKLMAQRAAELLAARNALALALAQGIRIDANGRIESIRGGSVHVEGMIRGHEAVETSWSPDARPPQARVTLRVPLWGVDGIAALFWRTRQVQSRYARERITLADPPELSTTAVVVIDARGLPVSECLFPAIVDSQGRVLYDIASLPTGAARSSPPVRYVTSRKTFEQLSTSSARTRSGANPQAPVQTFVMKAASLAASQRTDLVISASDAERLTRSPQAVAALRQARVLVLVDGPRLMP